MGSRLNTLFRKPAASPESGGVFRYLLMARLTGQVPKQGWEASVTSFLNRKCKHP